MWIVVSVMVSTLVLSGQASSRPLDRDVLASLYEATNGAGWENSNNWLSDEQLSAWHGVTVDSNGRVIR